MLLCLGNMSNECRRFDGEAPEDAHNLWETVLTSVMGCGEKSLKMSLYFGFRSKERCKLRGEVSK